MNEPFTFNFSPNSFRRTSALNQIQIHNDKDYKDISSRMNRKIKKEPSIKQYQTLLLNDHLIILIKHVP